MDIRAIWKVLISITIGIVISGCSMVAAPSDLIESPQPQDGQKLELKNTLIQLLPANIEFMTPKNGMRKQSIFMEDINGDGKQEAFVLYRNAKENQQVHLLVLEERNKAWTDVSDMEMSYHTLDYFDLHDLDDDGVMEVVMGLGRSDSDTEKRLVIYQWDQAELKKEIDRSYDVIDIADYDEDGKSDVLLIDGKRYEMYTAELFRYDNGRLESRSVVGLDPFASHERMVSGQLNDGKKALFIDSMLGPYSMLTEIIAYRNGELVTVWNEEEGLLSKIYPLDSKDINDDGKTEVGNMYIPAGWENTEFEEMIYIEFYSTYSIDGASKKVAERFTDREHRFYIEIPSAWFSQVTVKKIKNGIQIQSIADQKLLFEVKWTGKDSVDSPKTILKETKDTIFYTDRKEDQTFPFDQFQLLENEF